MIDVSTIDWNEAWNAERKRQHQAGKNRSCVDVFSDREICRKFNMNVQADNWKDARDRIREMDVFPKARVLDIGAGPGTLSIPLAGMVKDVTAVEPSPGMREFLEENIRNYKLDNVTVVPKPWEDIDPATDLKGPYDIVISSYSLGFPDLREALAKMNEVSCGTAYVFWFADMMTIPQKNYAPIWEDLFGVPARKNRAPNIVYNLLMQMGIYANVTVTRRDTKTRFADLETAFSNQKKMLHLTTPEQDEILKGYLRKVLKKDGDSCCLQGQVLQAMTWWKKDLA